MVNAIFEQVEGNLEFWVYLVPGAKKEAILETIDGNSEVPSKLRVAVCARPIENQANRALVKFLASQFKTAKTNILIKQGVRSRTKKISIVSYTMADIPDCLCKTLQLLELLR